MQPLLSLGEPRPGEPDGSNKAACWLDYSTVGLSATDAPALIALATDRDLNRADPPACYAPVHAWRALAQMNCQSAIVPLVALLEEMAKSDDDWGLQDLPEALALFGAAAVPELERFVRCQQRSLWARSGAARATVHIAKVYRDTRESVVKALTEQLSQSTPNDPGLNGLLVAMLIELKATESADAIRRAYGTGTVDEKVCGPIISVLAALG